MMLKDFYIFSKPVFQIDDSLSVLIKKTKKNPTFYSHFEKLNLYYSSNYFKLDIKQRKERRKVLNSFGIWSLMRICDKNEPGRQIKLSGKITDEYNQPIPSTKITIFQADDHGYYAPQDSMTHRMSEHDPRLYGSISTTEDGSYSLSTIHPGTYPMLYEGRHIQKHVHFNIVVKGFQSQFLQIVFYDDPAMKDKHWLDWAAALKYPVVKLDNTGNVSTAVFEYKT